jgi:DNA-binding response OmpR family regulator
MVAPVARVLIVEDDLAIQLLMSEALRSRGHEPFAVSDGPSAAPAAREHQPDLVLLDIGLPGLDGFGVLEQLKDDDELRDIPVIMVTAWGEPELMPRALEAGAMDYLRKPFDLEDLLGKVAIATRLRQS